MQGRNIQNCFCLYICIYSSVEHPVLARDPVYIYYTYTTPPIPNIYSIYISVLVLVFFWPLLLLLTVAVDIYLKYASMYTCSKNGTSGIPPSSLCVPRGKFALSDALATRSSLLPAPPAPRRLIDRFDVVYIECFLFCFFRVVSCGWVVRNVGRYSRVLDSVGKVYSMYCTSQLSVCVPWRIFYIYIIISSV